MESIHYRGEWKIKDISEETDTYGFCTIETYSPIMGEDIELCSAIINDADCEELGATFQLIAHANEMFEMLEKCYDVFKTSNSEMAEEINELLQRAGTEPDEDYEPPYVPTDDDFDDMLEDL